MTEEKISDIRERFYFFSGIALGALLGFFGGIYGTWFNDTYKTAWWFGYTVIASAVLFLGILLLYAYLVAHYGRILKKADKQKP